MAAVIAAIVLIILIVLDVIGHRKYRVRRQISDWVFLCVLIAGTAVCIYFSAGSLIRKDTGGNTGRYLAYRYLMDGDAAGARSAAIQNERMTEGQRRFLEMLACGIEGDYRRMYFAADEFLSDTSELPEQQAVAEELYTIAMNAAADGSNQRKAVDDCIAESFAVSGIRETVELQEYYELDRRIRDLDTDGIQARKINALLQSFPDETAVKKLAVSYFVLTGDFDSALAAAEDLLDEDKTAASRIIYTDIYAQMAYQMTEEQIRASEDKEIADLVRKSDAAAAKAQTYDEGSDNAVKQAELAASYLESAAQIYYQRVENYIKVKKPFLKDRTGLYDLQMIKMQFLKGEREAAKDAFADLLAEASALEETSPIRDRLLLMASDLKQYTQTGDAQSKDAVFEDCYEVFRAQSQDVIKTENADINADTAAQLAAMMVYSGDVFEITGIDASEYPKISVVLNTNVRKDNIFGGAGEFYKDDFKVRENDAALNEFSMTADIGVGERSLVIAGAVSSEASINDFRTALAAAENIRAAKRIALVNGDAAVVSGFEDSRSRYSSAVRSMGGETGSQAYEIFRTSCELLSGKKYEDRVIWFITDGSGPDEEEALSILSLLKENNVRCYILTLDEAGSETAKIITGGTGGMTFTCTRAEELSAAMSLLADLMNNEYIFTYKAGEEITGKHTVDISLKEEDLSAAADYLREGIS